MSDDTKKPRGNANWEVVDLEGLGPDELQKVINKAHERQTASRGRNKAAKEKEKFSENAGKQQVNVKSAEAKPLGPPTTFTQEIADLICEALAEGHSLRSICAAANMPAKSTVFKWLNEQKAFSDQYARAREAQADALFDDILEIADDGRNDTYIDDNGHVKTDTDVIARSKLRVEARKWMAGKLRPKVYGDKTTTELTGPNGGPVEFTGITRRIVKANE